MPLVIRVSVAVLALAGAKNPGDAAPAYPPPGRLVGIGSRALHLLCSGTGSPTVVLVAGGGAYSIDWALVQPRVAETVRVCSYDRAGVAWSAPGPADETVEQTVQDLHALLSTAGEPPPYVLVGASIGGIFVRAFQRAFPTDVAGLVFSNSSNRIGMTVGGRNALIWDLSETEVRSAYPLPVSVKPIGPPIRESAPFDRLPAELQATRLWLDIQAWERWEPDKMRPDAMLSWRHEFLREFDEMRMDDPLGTLPVIVISSEPVADRGERRSRTGAAPAPDFLSANSVHITASGSGHEVHLEQPQVVVSALTRIINAIRRGSPLQFFDDHQR